MNDLSPIATRRRWRTTAAAVLFSLSAGFALHAAWIPIKGRVAQALLQQAWRETVAGA